MGLNQTPSGERVHIGFFGLMNAGKSSLVNAVTGDSREELTAAVMEMAGKIMEKGPVALMMAKIAVNIGAGTDINTGLMLERLAQTIALSTEDRKEGTAAFLEKRKPEFRGR